MPCDPSTLFSGKKAVFFLLYSEKKREYNANETKGAAAARFF